MKMKNVYKIGFMVGLFGALTACGGADEAPKKDVRAAALQAEPAVPAIQAADRLDTREILPVNQLQRQHVLEEMRGLLGATQGMIEGLAENDMDAVQTAASAVGMNAMHTVENQKNMKRLKMGQAVPPEFRQLGQGVHKSFDEMAQMAADGKSAKDIQLKLAETMNACTACHATYQLPNP